MAKKKEEAKSEGGLHPQSKVTIIATEYSKYMKTGKEYVVSSVAAANLVKTKQATYK